MQWWFVVQVYGRKRSHAIRIPGGRTLGKSKGTFREPFVKSKNPVRKRNRLGKEPIVDEVLQWFGTVRAKGVELAGPLIIEKAKEISQELDCSGELLTLG